MLDVVVAVASVLATDAAGICIELRGRRSMMLFSWLLMFVYWRVLVTMH